MQSGVVRCGMAGHKEEDTFHFFVGCFFGKIVHHILSSSLSNEETYQRKGTEGESSFTMIASINSHLLFGSKHMYKHETSYHKQATKS